VRVKTDGASGAKMLKPTTAAAAAALILATAAQAADTRATAFPAFPRSKGAPAAIQWLLNETNLPLDKVTAISDSAIFALVEGPNAPPAGGGPLTVRMREEVLNAETAKTVGGRSALMIMQLDCGPRRLKLDALEVYEGSNLQGAMKRQRGGDWLVAPPDSYLADVIAAGCDPGYRYPYAAVPAAAPAQTAAAPPSKPPPPKPPEPAPSAAAAALRPSMPPPPPTAAANPPPARVGGAFQAQVGSFNSSEAAWAELAKLAATYRTQMTGHSQAVERSTATPRMHRALVGGFASLRDAEAFCTALRADRRPCMARR